MLSSESPVGSEVTAAQAKASDRRDAARHTLFIRSAKLLMKGAEYLCVLCDASETGAKVRFFHPLPESPKVTLELQNEDQLEAEMVWRKGDKAGLCFIEQTQMARILAMDGAYQKRPVRVRLNVASELTVEGSPVECTMVDLSQHGAKVLCSQPLAVRQSVMLKADGLPMKVPAKVCWRRGEQVGLSFETVFQFFELARIAYAMQGGKPLADEFLGIS